MARFSTRSDPMTSPVSGVKLPGIFGAGRGQDLAQQLEFFLLGQRRVIGRDTDAT